MQDDATFQRGDGPGPGKVHSIAGVLGDRTIAGEFEADGRAYAFSFAPTSVAVRGRRIELTGDFAAGPAGGPTRAPVRGVRAVLASTQGGIGRAPVVRRELLALTAQGPETAKGDEQEHREGQPEAPAPAVTEATGAAGFVGVMYLRLAPLDARALGVAADMRGVQLNARLAPTSRTERELQWLFSGLVMAVLGERPDARAASAYAGEINRLLKA